MYITIQHVNECQLYYGWLDYCNSFRIDMSKTKDSQVCRVLCCTSFLIEPCLIMYNPASIIHTLYTAFRIPKILKNVRNFFQMVVFVKYE